MRNPGSKAHDEHLDCRISRSDTLATGRGHTTGRPRRFYLATWDTLYKSYDLDSDGKVTAQEIAQKMTADQQTKALVVNREIFARLDRDGNGSLSPEEFALLVAKVPQSIRAHS